ncbi:MAG TPA: hypothetical protein VIQ05_17245 [Tardiphaga sp.]
MRPTKDPFHRPAMQTLERLHAELGGRILDNKVEGDSLRLQMQQVEAVLKMLDPTYSVRGISVKRRKTNQWFKRGTLYRRALDVLRTAEQPMTATELADAVLAAAQIETDDRKSVSILGQSIQASLQNHRGKGVQQVNEGIPARWSLML